MKRFSLCIALFMMCHLYAVDEMRGLFLVLKEFQEETHYWRRPFHHLPTTGTLVIADPIKSLSPLEKEGLDQWIDRGGRVILMKESDWVIEKTGYNTIDSMRSFRHSYGIKKVGENPVQAGSVLVIPEVYTNEKLEEGIWLVQEILKEGGPIYFDQYHQHSGEGEGFFPLMWRFIQTKWGLALLHSALVFILTLFFMSKKKEVYKEQEIQKDDYILSRGQFLQSIQASKFCQKAIMRCKK